MAYEEVLSIIYQQGNECQSHMNYHFSSVRLATTKKEITNADMDLEKSICCALLIKITVKLCLLDMMEMFTHGLPIAVVVYMTPAQDQTNSHSSMGGSVHKAPVLPTSHQSLIGRKSVFFDYVFPGRVHPQWTVLYDGYYLDSELFRNKIRRV